MGYFIIFLWFVIFCLLSNSAYINKQINSALFCWASLVVFIIMCKDNTKVPDVETYMDLFSMYARYSFEDAFAHLTDAEDIGYSILNILCSRVSNNYYFFQFVYSLIIAFSYMLLIKRYSTNIILSGYFAICSSFFLLFLMRFALAFSICLFALDYAIKRKPIHFAVCILLAVLFHKSAIIFSIVYFLPYLKFNFKYIILFCAITLFAGLSVESIISQAIVIADSSHFEAYIESDSMISWKVLVIPLLSFLIILIGYRNKFHELTKAQELLIYMNLLAIVINVINVMGTSFSAFYRLDPYFSFVSVIIIPDALRNIKSSLFRKGLTIVTMGLFLYNLIATAESQRGFGFIF